LVVKFQNGSDIMITSSSRTLCGKSASDLVIDEACYIEDDLLEASIPMSTRDNSNIFMYSSPRFKSGFFYRAYNSNHWKSIELPYTSVPGRDEDWLKKQRDLLNDDKIIDNEFMCKFADKHIL